MQWNIQVICYFICFTFAVSNAHTAERCNGCVSVDSSPSNVQRSCSALEKDQRENRSVLDCIMGGGHVDMSLNTDSDNGVSNSVDTNSDSNFRKKSRLSETPGSSKDILSDDNYDDCFDSNYCNTCNKTLSTDKTCSHCSKDVFPSQAATPRRPLSAHTFYSHADDRKPKVQRTYNNNRLHRNGVRKLLEPGSVAKMSDVKKSNNERSQTNLTLKKRKNQGKVSWTELFFIKMSVCPVNTCTLSRLQKLSIVQ